MAKILTGGPADHLVTNEPLGEFLFRRLKENGDDICLTNATKRQQWTNREVLDVSLSLSRGLRQRGFGKGDIITLYSSNSEQFAFLVLGSVHAGLTISTINPAATAYEIQHYLKEISPRLIFTEKALLTNIETATDAIGIKAKIFTNGKTGQYDDLMDLCSVSADVSIPGQSFDVRNDVVAIMFSSGTSGLPKGVMLTHYNVTSYLFGFGMYGINPETTSCMAPFPLYHGGGLFGCLFGLISEKINFIFMERFDFKLMLESIQLYKPESVGLPPSLVVLMAKSPLVDRYNLSSMKVCITGAAPITKETERAFQERFNFPKTQQGYGMTEVVAGVIYKGYRDDPNDGLGSSGKAEMGVEIKIVDPETGVMLGPDSRGEILIRTPQIMKGYLNRPDATKQTIDSEGWLHSGDVGYYDNKDYIYVVDRLKELIKYKGNQVAPAELEALLLEHPDVADVGVVGISDAEAGELPRAYVVKQAGADVSVQDIHKFVNDHVSYYKRLRGGVVFLKEIPKLPSGKILRRHLRELAKNESKL